MLLIFLVKIEKRLEISENVNYIGITSRASKLQVFKVQPGWDLNPGPPRLGESVNIEKLTHAGGPDSNSDQADV